MKNILDKTYKSIVGKKLLYQVFCCISPTAMGIILSSSATKTWIINNVPEWMRNLLLAGWFQVVLIILFGIIIPCLISGLIEYLEYKNKRTGYEILLCLMSNIDNAVKEKRQRYKEVRKSKYKTDSTIFRNISKPRDQIRSLCRAFCVMMQFLTNDEMVKSSILYCKNSKIGDVLAVCGEDSIKCQIEELNNKSLAKDVVEKGKSIIVNDTDKSELFFKPKGCRAKSALAMPVFDGNELLFVVCFSSPNKDCFKEKRIAKYEQIIEEISDRVLLEWHLHELLKMGKQ